ncbi:MAG: cobalamin biosynthesis protein CobD [Proteobacteria bacterium]|nr:cobalamin biosynthesis protein CobD [Pseudomonadota bacterium]
MTPAVFLGAYIVDIVVGDPRRFPHPVIIIGKFVGFLEGKIPPLVKGGFIDEKKAGIILWFAVVAPSFFITWGIVEGCFFINSLFGAIIAILLASLTLATRSLYDESRVVLSALNSDNLEEARKSLSMIVGRDTKNLNEEEILRAVIETVSENLSDGIVAPMFYLAVGGLPLAMAYKAVNTLDSMVGYKNARYKDIGCFSARMDDIFNWIPARLTGLIIILAAFILRLNWRDSWRIMRRDGRNHSSPNSGIPEAAVAGSLGIQLGGENRYFGEIVSKPTIGDRINGVGRGDVKKTWAVMFASSLLMAIFCMTTLWIIQL